MKVDISGFVVLKNVKLLKVSLNSKGGGGLVFGGFRKGFLLNGKLVFSLK